MFKCNCCGREFAHPKADRQKFGEAFGQPAFDNIDVCPFCGDEDIDESRYMDVYGKNVYTGDTYYELGVDIVHEDNLTAYINDNECQA